MNNRVEEAIGESIDLRYAIEKELVKATEPPTLGYALIVKKDEKSSRICKKPKEPHFDTDPAFGTTTYINRFGILCKRLLDEGMFETVWFVVADPIEKTVEEPDPKMTYERFIDRISMKKGIRHRDC